MSNLIKSWNDRAIRIRSDRYVSLTDMAQASGKLFADWNKLKSTKNYLKTLSGVMQICITDLVQVIHPDTGGDANKFREVQMAYETAIGLLPELRKAYNQH